MTHEEIEVFRRRLQEILSRKKTNGEYESGVQNDLEALAAQVGASTSWFVPEKQRELTSGSPPSLLAHNIHLALQTASMIDACRTAARNHEIALKAQKSAWLSQWVSVFAMLGTVAAAIAAWIAATRP